MEHTEVMLDGKLSLREERAFKFCIITDITQITRPIFSDAATSVVIATTISKIEVKHSQNSTMV